MGNSESADEVRKEVKRDQASESSEDEENGMKYKYPPTVEHHLTGNACAYVLHVNASTKHKRVFVRVCDCGLRQSKKGRLQLDTVHPNQESDGIEIHYSRRCKWMRIPEAEEFDHLVRICKCVTQKRAAGSGAASTNR